MARIWTRRRAGHRARFLSGRFRQSIPRRSSEEVDGQAGSNGHAQSLARSLDLRAVLVCCAAAAVAVAMDAYYSAQEGYLARPAEYDVVGCLVDAQTPFRLIHALHLKTAFVDLFTGISPLWVSVLTTQQLILGGGTWQAFSARFWAVALLLMLVYWIVSRRAPRRLAIVAVVLTAL